MILPRMRALPHVRWGPLVRHRIRTDGFISGVFLYGTAHSLAMNFRVTFRLQCSLLRVVVVQTATAFSTSTFDSRESIQSTLSIALLRPHHLLASAPTLYHSPVTLRKKPQGLHISMATRS